MICQGRDHPLTVHEVVSMQSARLGSLPGDRENVVKLKAGHGGVCKFGPSQTDQDNFELVRGNIRDIYKNAIRDSELRTAPAVTGPEENIGNGEAALQERFARLQEGAPRAP